MIDIQAAHRVAAHRRGVACAGGWWTSSGGSRPARGHRRRCSWRWPTRAGRCGRRRPSTWPPSTEAALLPALEAALRDDENAALRNAAMEIYVKMGPRPRRPLLALLRDADEEVRNFAAVMLGARRERAGGARR